MSAQGVAKASAKRERPAFGRKHLADASPVIVQTSQTVSQLLLCRVSDLSDVLLTVFRDTLCKHLEAVPAGDFDGYAKKLDDLGSVLDYRK